MKTKEVTILLVDDDEIDVEGAVRGLQRAKIANKVVVAHDGIDALEHLRGENGKPRLERPYILLIDLNMPRMSGLELLTAIRADAELADTIVFVLTTSDYDKDRWSAYQANIAGYILKSNVGSEFEQLVSMIDHYWKVVELPTEPPRADD